MTETLIQTIEIDDTDKNASQKHLTILEYKTKKLQEEITDHSRQLAGQDLKISKKQNVTNSTGQMIQLIFKSRVQQSPLIEFG